MPKLRKYGNMEQRNEKLMDKGVVLNKNLRVNDTIYVGEVIRNTENFSNFVFGDHSDYCL